MGKKLESQIWRVYVRGIWRFFRPFQIVKTMRDGRVKIQFPHGPVIVEAAEIKPWKG